MVILNSITSYRAVSDLHVTRYCKHSNCGKIKPKTSSKNVFILEYDLFGSKGSNYSQKYVLKIKYWSFVFAEVKHIFVGIIDNTIVLNFQYNQY